MFQRFRSGDNQERRSTEMLDSNDLTDHFPLRGQNLAIDQVEIIVCIRREWDQLIPLNHNRGPTKRLCIFNAVDSNEPEDDPAIVWPGVLESNRNQPTRSKPEQNIIKIGKSIGKIGQDVGDHLTTQSVRAGYPCNGDQFLLRALDF